MSAMIVLTCVCVHARVHVRVCPACVIEQIMVDPVTTIDGMTYSRSTITKWLVPHCV